MSWNLARFTEEFKRQNLRWCLAKAINKGGHTKMIKQKDTYFSGDTPNCCQNACMLDRRCDNWDCGDQFQCLTCGRVHELDIDGVWFWRELGSKEKKPATTKKSCATCIYSYGPYKRTICNTGGFVSTDKHTYECRINPPSRKGWPRVEADDACGQFQGKDYGQDYAANHPGGNI